MENNNSEKTGRLTPGQIDKIVSLSHTISLINRLFESYREDERFLLSAKIGSRNDRILLVTREYLSLIDNQDTLSYTMLDDEFFSMVKDYFTEKRSRLESELAAVISGEGGER